MKGDVIAIQIRGERGDPPRTRRVAGHEGGTDRAIRTMNFCGRSLCRARSSGFVV